MGAISGISTRWPGRGSDPGTGPWPRTCTGTRVIFHIGRTEMSQCAMRIFVEGANTVQPVCLCQGNPLNGCAPNLAIKPPRDRLIIRIVESCLRDNAFDRCRFAIGRLFCTDNRAIIGRRRCTGLALGVLWSFVLQSFWWDRSFWRKFRWIVLYVWLRWI